MQRNKDGPFGGLRCDLIWRDPRPLKSNLGQRFVRLDCQCAAPIDDLLIVQIRLPLPQSFKLRFYGNSYYELVINFENALGRLYIRYLNPPVGGQGCESATSLLEH